MKFVIHTLGCKTNQYDSQAMADALLRAGWEQGEPADLAIVNTCTVTAEADRKCRQVIRQAVEKAGHVIVTGCYAQRDPQALAKELEADFVLGHNERADIVAWAEKAVAGEKGVAVTELGRAFASVTIDSPGEHTRANLKVQDGCENFCTYCIIPKARGPVRSRDLTETVEEARRLAKLGVKELVLTGIHLASYGRDWGGKPGLIDLMEALDKVPGVERIRLGSLEPVLVTEDFCQRIKKMQHLCHQFHLALQSGCDATLKRMGRRYTTEEFELAAQRIREVLPDAMLTTDVIVGFPGETQEEFEASLAFVEKMAFGRIHVFPFSAREGTAAARMKQTVSKKEKHDRAQRMIALGQRLAREAEEAVLGTIRLVLVEEDETGYTDTYLKVRVPGGKMGELCTVRLIRIEKDEILGEKQEVLP